MSDGPDPMSVRSRVAAALRRAAGVLGRRKVGLALAAGGLLAVVPPVLFAVWTWRAAAGVDLGRVQDATVLYSAPRALTPGASIEAADLLGSLRRLGYREVSAAPRSPGQFRRAEDSWDLFLRPREDPGATRPALKVRLALDGPRIAGVTTPEAGAGAAGGPGAAASGETLPEVELEPEPLAGLGDTAGQLRLPARLDDLPADLVNAVLAIEDQRFLEHPGVDVRGVLRAVWVNLRRGRVREGGSTITQQLVKNLVLTPRRTLTRKLQEAAIALWLERRYSKREILEAYLNGIYLGQHGSFAVHGVGAAARSYLGKDVERLTLGEAALLAGLIRAPNTYSPLHHPERARERRDVVLRRLRDLGKIDEARYRVAARETLRIPRGPAPRVLGPNFLDLVRVEVERLDDDAGGGPAGALRVYTTLDPALQRAAEAALARGLDRLEGQYRHLRRKEPAERLQGALLVLDVQTGEIRAMVGGRDYALSQFNRTTQARRQPGSAFKPFVYLAALGFGARGEPPHFTPASLVEDRPLTVGTGRNAWTPRNYEGRYEGTVTVRRALEQSLNAATVWVAEAVGYDAIIRTAREAGITSPLEPLPSLTLGSFELTPIELATAYAALANGGHRVTPASLRAVVDREGQAVDLSLPAPVRALRPDEAFLVTSLLMGVVDRGTGAAARALGLTGPAAGKTGTTNDGRDAWFVGFSPRIVALVWVGFDSRDSLRLSGGQAAVPIWADFMKTAGAIVPAGAFTPPPSVVFRNIDASNGKLAALGCPLVIREAFLSSTEPRETCPDHGAADALRGFFRRLLDPSAVPRPAMPGVSTGGGGPGRSEPATGSER
jgi:penicillin-binding protein 1B